MAKIAQRCIMAALDHSRAPKIVLVDEESDAGTYATLELPPQALRFFAEILGTLARREPFSLIPQQALMSTQDAANYLNVSRPFVVKQLEQGKIDYLQVGRHRRIEFHKLVAFSDSLKHNAHAALQELTEQAQDLNMGY